VNKRDRQVHQLPQHGTCDPLSPEQVFYSACQRDVGEPLNQRANRYLGLEARQRGTETEMDPVAEREMLWLAHDVEPIRVGESLWIAVRRGPDDRNDGAPGNDHPRDLYILRCDPQCRTLGDPFVAEDLFDS
jgi:hypothetical protein